MSRVSSFLREHWITLLVILGLAVGYFALRTSPTEIASAREFVNSLSEGQPTIVYFYSNG